MQPTASMRFATNTQSVPKWKARHRELMTALRQIAILLGLIAGAIIVVAIVATHASP
jgi:type IV secretory pathway TrbD component